MRYEDFFEQEPPRQPKDPQAIALIFVLVLVALVAFFATGCSEITGTKPAAKPCLTDTTFWLYERTQTGRIIDSALVHETIDSCR